MNSRVVRYYLGIASIVVLVLLVSTVSEVEFEWPNYFYWVVSVLTLILNTITHFSRKQKNYDTKEGTNAKENWVIEFARRKRKSLSLIGFVIILISTNPGIKSFNSFMEPHLINKDLSDFYGKGRIANFFIFSIYKFHGASSETQYWVEGGLKDEVTWLGIFGNFIPLRSNNNF